ncbi:hypothetical protein CYMTET_10635 [Cymbomonas tetramitiformis]|uniref:Uncharacterized protein n=1 Tax=Cymbomonas tetramitiformis TaxID=36881 RepID=A0AAE0GNT0_9CHLO|nr:hypothetical protein CYMTET_10635 [Cymbomonas tetramitiformis]
MGGVQEDIELLSQEALSLKWQWGEMFTHLRDVESTVWETMLTAEEMRSKEPNGGGEDRPPGQHALHKFWDAIQKLAPNPDKQSPLSRAPPVPTSLLGTGWTAEGGASGGVSRTSKPHHMPSVDDTTHEELPEEPREESLDSMAKQMWERLSLPPKSGEDDKYDRSTRNYDSDNQEYPESPMPSQMRKSTSMGGEDMQKMVERVQDTLGSVADYWSNVPVPSFLSPAKPEFHEEESEADERYAPISVRSRTSSLDY